MLRARLLIAFADGQEEAGFVTTARRMRLVARDSLRLGQELHIQLQHRDGEPA